MPFEEHMQIQRIRCLAVVLVATISLMTETTITMAFCYEPTAPDAPWGGPPSPPYCFNEWDKTHTCQQWEIDSWIDEINSYIRKMVNYANEANEFASDAVDYANCQIAEAKSPLE